MTIGTATIPSPSLGLLLALGPAPADVPEGSAAIAALRAAGITRRARVLMSARFALPILLGAALGYFTLPQAPELLTLSVLTVTGGALTNVVEEMLTEAHEGDTSVWDPILPTGDLALFATISVYLEP